MTPLQALMRNENFRSDMQHASKDLVALKSQRAVPPVEQCRSEEVLKKLTLLTVRRVSRASRLDAGSSNVYELLTDCC